MLCLALNKRLTQIPVTAGTSDLSDVKRATKRGGACDWLPAVLKPWLRQLEITWDLNGRNQSFHSNHG